MTKTILSWIRFAFTVPWALVCWAVVALASLLFVAQLRKLKFERAGVLTTEWRPWVARFFPYSLTLGRGIIYYPGAQQVHKAHEYVHVAQVEDFMHLSFWVGLIVALCTGDVLLGFFLWWSGGIWQLPNYITSLLRYGHLVIWPSGGNVFGRLA